MIGWAIVKRKLESYQGGFYQSIGGHAAPTRGLPIHGPHRTPPRRRWRR